MKAKFETNRNKGASKIIMALVMFFVLSVAMLLVSCSADNIKITYKTIVGVEQELTVKKGTTIGEIGDAAVVTGYTFEGWYKDPTLYVKYSDDEKLEADTELYPNYTPNKYQVVFYSNNGKDNTETKTIEFGSTFKLPANQFSYENHDFVGWSQNKNDAEGSNTIIRAENEVMLTTEGASYYAIWSGSIYDVEYNFNDALLNGAEISLGGLPASVQFGKTLTLPNFEGTVSKVGDDLGDYTFLGFKIGDVSYSPGEKITITSALIDEEKITISIQWITGDQGLASFNQNKPQNDQKAIPQISSVDLTRNADDNFELILPSCPDLNGHRFLGWKANNSGEVLAAGSTYTTTRSLTTFYAVWQAQSRTITLVDGDSAVSIISTKYGEVVQLPTSGNPTGDYAKTDRWQFLGWKKELPSQAATTNYSGETTILFTNAECNLDGSITLYANYLRKQVELEFIANGGNGAIENMLVNTAETFTVTPEVYNELSRSRQYYSLVGFSTSQNATIGSFAIDVGTEDMTLFAIWNRNKITISTTPWAKDAHRVTTVRRCQGST